jgi:hypothetical protein
MRDLLVPTYLVGTGATKHEHASGAIGVPGYISVHIPPLRLFRICVGRGRPRRTRPLAASRTCPAACNRPATERRRALAEASGIKAKPHDVCIVIRLDASYLGLCTDAQRGVSLMVPRAWTRAPRALSRAWPLGQLERSMATAKPSSRPAFQDVTITLITDQIVDTKGSLTRVDFNLAAFNFVDFARFLLLSHSCSSEQQYATEDELKSTIIHEWTRKLTRGVTSAALRALTAWIHA